MINKKIAVVHEWLEILGGSEKVTLSLLNIYKTAKLYCVVNFLNDKSISNAVNGEEIKTTFIQNLPFARRKFRLYFPFIYFAIRRFDLKEFDVVVSSSHAFAHSVKTNKNQLHICYCHTPMRYVWDLQKLYFQENGWGSVFTSIIPALFAKFLRRLDYKTAQTVDYFVANSKNTQSRIINNYNKDAVVIYPPIDIHKFQVEVNKKDFYFISSRMVCYKKVDIIVEAFAKMPDKKLIISGEGKYKKELMEMATPNVTFIPFQPFEQYSEYMRNAKAFMFAANEDFGITMAEAQACGTPVIAYAEGGALEIVVDGETGILFKEQTADSIVDAVTKFEQMETAFSADKIRQNSERFSQERFDKEMMEFTQKYINEKGI